MKIILRLFLPLSLVFNTWFLYKYYKGIQFKNTYESVFTAKYTNFNDGTNYLLNRIKAEQPKLNNKKYFFICIWNMACGPCVKEMPTLDSLIENIGRNDIGCIHLTENGNALVNKFLKQKKITLRNFVFMNDGNDYILSLLKQQNIKNKSYPMQLILNDKGEIQYFGGSFIQSSKDSILFSEFK